MAKSVSTSFIRRSVAAGLTLTAASAAVLVGADNAHAQAKQAKPEKSLYDRVGWRIRYRCGGGSLQRRGRQESSRRPELREPATAGMAHQEPRKAPRPQVHADALGVRRFGWSLPVHGHQARRQDAARP